MDELLCRRFLVSGRVQGVCFRASTARQARELSISGHAINLPDGRVEVIALGSREAMGRLEAWLHQGPEYSVVENVIAEDADSSAISGGGFRTG